MADTAAVVEANAGDNRRAATLRALRPRRYRWRQCGDGGPLRSTASLLYLAVMNLHAVVIPKLYTVDGLACLTDLVYRLAGDGRGSGLQARGADDCRPQLR